MLQAVLDSSREGLSDAEIARRVAAGDEAVFRLMMRRHNQKLYRAARSILRDDAEAEDAVQEAYLLAYRAMGKFRGDAKLSTWLTRIVINEAIGRSRRQKRAAELIRLDGDRGEHGGQGETSPETDMNEDPTERPDASAERAQIRRLLEQKIDELPEMFRAVFMLRAVEEMTTEEVAVVLEIPEATVRTRFFRARALLREALAREMDFALDGAFAFDGARCDRIVDNVLLRLKDLRAQ